MSEWRALWLAACLLAAPAVAVEIDGRIDAGEWAGARHITDFRKVQPLNGEPASLPTEVWVLSTPDGLAVAFRNVQPPSVPRTQQRVQRDFEEQVDRVNVMLDFDGDGNTGYDFTISSTTGVSLGPGVSVAVAVGVCVAVAAIVTVGDTVAVGVFFD